MAALCNHPSMSFHQVALLEGAISESRTDSTPAAQPQGLPVAVMYADGSVLTKAECGIAFEVCCKVETPLYAEQPAPVAVVLPERLLGDDGVCTESHYASGWNACLYEAARLTATVRIPERLVMTDGLHTYEYVTGHNAAIDKMLGVQS